MFSLKEKQFIAAELEKIILSLKHPEMPTERPKFKLHIDGEQSWSWADIEPNWTFENRKPSKWAIIEEVSKILYPNRGKRPPHIPERLDTEHGQQFLRLAEALDLAHKAGIEEAAKIVEGLYCKYHKVAQIIDGGCDTNGNLLYAVKAIRNHIEKREGD